MIYQAYQSIAHQRNPMSGSALPTCDLLIYLLGHKMYYVLVSPQHEIVACCEYRNADPALSKTMFLRLVFEREEILSFPYSDCQVFLGDPNFTLVPDKYHSPEGNLLLARLFLDDWTFESELVERKLGFHPDWFLFLRSEALSEVLHEYLPYHTLSHVVYPAMGVSYRLLPQHPSHLLILLLAGKMIMVVQEEGRLKLCNQFPCQSPADLLYFSEAVGQSCLPHNTDIPIFWMGEDDNEIAAGIHHYLPGIRQPKMTPETSTSGYWRYGFLTERGERREERGERREQRKEKRDFVT
jgi:hypothetical protein